MASCFSLRRPFYFSELCFGEPMTAGCWDKVRGVWLFRTLCFWTFLMLIVKKPWPKQSDSVSWLSEGSSLPDSCIWQRNLTKNKNNHWNYLNLKCLLCLTARTHRNIDRGAQPFVCQCFPHDQPVLSAFELGPLMFMLPDCWQGKWSIDFSDGKWQVCTKSCFIERRQSSASFSSGLSLTYQSLWPLISKRLFTWSCQT